MSRGGVLKTQLKIVSNMYLRSSAIPLLRMMPLLASLKEFRADRAMSGGIPVFCVFGDTVLNAIADQRPRTPEALLKIRGMSEEKCKEYGSEVLRIVAACSTACLPQAARSHSPERARPMRACRTQRLMKDAVASSGRRLQRAIELPEGDVVYILELLLGRVYVGRTRNLRRRLDEHASGRGSAFTRMYPPTGLLLPRLGNVSGSGEAAERDETLRYMYLRGIECVRGWKYTRVEMPAEDREDAEGNIRELFDLCRKCGHPGHFMCECRQNYDRHGRLICTTRRT